MTPYRPAAIIITFLMAMSVPALPQEAQPQFKSSELQVTVNRARRNAADQLMISLRFTNVSQENLAFYGSGGAEATTETGDALASWEIKGLPVCTVDCQLTNAIIGLYADPVIIEPGNALAATFIFPGDAQTGSCSLDLSMRIYAARLGRNPQLTSKEKWHLVPVSLANVRVC
jgi:hypothetical protein